MPKKNIFVPLDENEVKQQTPAKLRKCYNDLAESFNKILDNKLMLCPKCNEWKISFGANSQFYMSKGYATGKFPVCKNCLQLMAEQRPDVRKPVNETKESIQHVLRFMDLPYNDKLYGQLYKRKAEAATEDEVAQLSIFPNYIRTVNTLQQYEGQTWKDSDFGDVTSIDDEDVADIKIVKSTVADGRKRFGPDYSDEDLMFLQNEYKDWVSRYECKTKAQEKVFEGLCMVELQRHRAIKKNQPTKELDKSYQEWLDTGNLKPKQNTMDAFSEAQTFGTLIQKYEEERPLPEIDPDLRDVDKIGRYIDTFFKGHICKVLGIKNNFSNAYENEMKKYTVTPPEFDEDEDSEAIFDKIFGGNTDG